MTNTYRVQMTNGSGVWEDYDEIANITAANEQDAIELAKEFFAENFGEEANEGYAYRACRILGTTDEYGVPEYGEWGYED